LDANIDYGSAQPGFVGMRGIVDRLGESLAGKGTMMRDSTNVQVEFAAEAMTAVKSLTHAVTKPCTTSPSRADVHWTILGRHRHAPCESDRQGWSWLRRYRSK
jgi:hypothetical protein